MSAALDEAVRRLMGLSPGEYAVVKMQGGTQTEKLLGRDPRESTDEVRWAIMDKAKAKRARKAAKRLP